MFNFIKKSKLVFMKFVFLSFLSFQFSYFFFIGFSDAPKNWQLGFQDPATPIMEGIVDFHNHLMIFIVGIAIFVIWLLIRCIYFHKFDDGLDICCGVQAIRRVIEIFSFIKNGARMPAYSFAVAYRRFLEFLPKSYDELFTHATLLEIIWTIFPAIILMVIALPSFALLYAMEEIIIASLTLKIVGHQWYWSYEYPEVPILDVESDFINDSVIQEEFKADADSWCFSYNELLLCFKGKHSVLSFDSYMLAEDDLPQGTLRLLEVEKRVTLPEKTHIRLLVTAADVLHSWTVPSFGVKVDACPGRLNQATLFLKRCGTFFGQCSEICGVNHGFMPVVVRVFTINEFLAWSRSSLFSS
jgi:cytochrome c oxidase subunit 2